MGGVFSKVGALWGSTSSRESDDSTKAAYQQFEQDVLQAVKKGDLERLQNLKAESVLVWGGLENINTTPSLLQVAACYGHEDVVQFLLDLGVDADETDTCDMSALHEACKQRHMGCVRLLVTRMRNIDSRDVWGRTPLIKALVYRNTEAAEFLLEKGANPNAVDIYGITPLTTTLDYNQIDMVRCLVRHGASVNLITQHLYKTSGPPLYQAINNQSLTMVNELLRLGASTVPRPEECSKVSRLNTASMAAWQYFSGSMPTLFPNMQYGDAVSMAMGELLKRDVLTLDTSSPGIEILMSVLAAHGNPLGPSPDVLVRVLVNSRAEDFQMLLHKMRVCSSSSQENTFLSTTDRDANARPATRPQHLQQLDQHLNRGNNSSNKTPRIIMSLQNQARRAARRAVMASGRNVFWACKRLQCPPALKTLLMLKDIDRAYGPPLLKKQLLPDSS